MFVFVIFFITIGTTLGIPQYDRTKNGNTTLTPVVLPAQSGKFYNEEVNSTVQYIFQFRNLQVNKTRPARVRVESTNANRSYPLLIVARQQKGVISWQLPLVVESKTVTSQFMSTSRTLCPGDYSYSVDRAKPARDVTVSISTGSPTSLKFSLRVIEEDDFVVNLHEKKNVSVSPAKPHYYHFKFEDTESVLLRVDSDDDICMIVSIQNLSCPVFDQERNVAFKGYWQTVTRRGGIILTKAALPEGFYVVFVVKNNDWDCTNSPQRKSTLRTKWLSFSISPTISYKRYVISSVGALMIFFLFYVFSIVMSVVYFIRKRVQNGNSQQEETGIDSPQSGVTFIEHSEVDAGSSSENARNADDQVLHEQHNQHGTDLQEDVSFVSPQSSAEPTNNSETSNTENTITEVTSLDSGAPRSEEETPLMENGSINPEISRRLSQQGESHEEQQSTSMQPASADEAAEDVKPKKRRARVNVFVVDTTQNDLKKLSIKSQRYLWNLLTVAVFYSLPVIQLVINYQLVLKETGNHDLCYYNFLCAHPLGLLSDFNHVFSNIGYVLLGLLFMFLTYRRHILQKMEDPERSKEYGIPQHYGLFYAMGVALIMEGVLSACYHVCPNHSNFQFDTSFMYVISLMCMIKLYQARHPDISSSAYIAFGVLAIIILVGVLGVFWDSLGFRITFTILHLTSCLYFSAKIYYMGKWNLDFSVFKKIYIGARNMMQECPWPCAVIRHVHRMVLLTLGNMCNWGLAIWGLVYSGADFPTHLLSIFMANLLLYFVFYIVMKLVKGERILMQPLIYIVLSIASWGAAGYYFFSSSTQWAVSPALSKELNKPCVILDFYDTHDIWHFLSAASLFFSFMILLTLDDDLILVHHSKIHEF